MNDATLRRLSRFDAANLGPHAIALYRELTRTAACRIAACHGHSCCLDCRCGAA